MEAAGGTRRASLGCLFLPASTTDPTQAYSANVKEAQVYFYGARAAPVWGAPDARVNSLS